MTYRKKVEKIISVSNTDGIRFEDESLLYEYIEDEKCKIRKCTVVSERRTKSLRLALLCEQHGIEREAVDCFRDTLVSITSLKKGTEEYDICRQAYDGLFRLYNSEDEYVWETASQAIDEAGNLFQEQ